MKTRRQMFAVRTHGCAGVLARHAGIVVNDDRFLDLIARIDLVNHYAARELSG